LFFVWQQIETRVSGFDGQANIPGAWGILQLPDPIGFEFAVRDLGVCPRVLDSRLTGFAPNM